MELLEIPISWDFILFILCGGLLSGFIDSIAGGGGLISLPVFLALGIPPHYAIGTNKFAATFGSFMSSIQFIRARKVDMGLMKKLIPFTFIGAVCGCLLMLYMSAAVLQPVVIGALVLVAIFVFTRRDLGSHSSYAGETKRKLLLAAAFAFGIGVYDGFVGPGTGTFLIISFAMLGFDFVLAAGNAKILNFVSNITAFCVFIFAGKVLFAYGLTMALGIFIGAYFGSRMAIHRGSGFVRLIMMTVTTLLIGKLVLQYIGVL